MFVIVFFERLSTNRQQNGQEYTTNGVNTMKRLQISRNINYDKDTQVKQILSLESISWDVI